MKNSHVIVLIATLALLVPTSFAVICSSFTTPEMCDGTYTDVGLCAWDTTTKTCSVSDVPLPPGKVGITAIPSFDPTTGDPPIAVDPPFFVPDFPDNDDEDVDPSSPVPPTSPVVAIPQWNKVDLNNTQAITPITQEVQNLLSTAPQSSIAPLCIYKRDPDVWAIYATGNDQQQGYVLAQTSCTVSMTAGDNKEKTSCMYYLMNFDETSGQSSPGFAGTDAGGGSDGSAAGGGGVIEPAEPGSVVPMSVEPNSGSSNANQYSLISVSAAEELCNVGPTEDEPVVGEGDILLVEPAIIGEAESIEKDDVAATVQEVASSDGGVVVMRMAIVMMIVGVALM